MSIAETCQHIAEYVVDIDCAQPKLKAAREEYKKRKNEHDRLVDGLNDLLKSSGCKLTKRSYASSWNRCERDWDCASKQHEKNCDYCPSGLGTLSKQEYICIETGNDIIMFKYPERAEKRIEDVISGNPVKEIIERSEKLEKEYNELKEIIERQETQEYEKLLSKVDRKNLPKGLEKHLKSLKNYTHGLSLDFSVSEKIIGIVVDITKSPEKMLAVQYLKPLTIISGLYYRVALLNKSLRTARDICGLFDNKISETSVTKVNRLLKDLESAS